MHLLQLNLIVYLFTYGVDIMIQKVLVKVDLRIEPKLASMSFVTCQYVNPNISIVLSLLLCFRSWYCNYGEGSETSFDFLKELAYIWQNKPSYSISGWEHGIPLKKLKEKFFSKSGNSSKKSHFQEYYDSLIQSVINGSFLRLYQLRFQT